MTTLLKREIVPVFTEDVIQKRIKELADILNEEYKDKEVYVVGVLKGSVMFAVDLVKNLTMPVKMEFIRLSSYGAGTKSSGKVNALNLSLPDLNGKDVIIVEDIVDSGYTARYIKEFICTNFKVNSYKFVSLLDKKCRREVDISPDLYGFDVEDKFLVGYGLDYDGYYRNLRYIGAIEV